MKLFSKKSKSKKPLSDKAKQEKKDKIKHIIKRVLDIIVYGFAIFMIFGLLIGSCSSKPKVANAYYHSDNGYTSMSSVVSSPGTTTTLRYYYDYNYKMTFPNWASFYDGFGSTTPIAKLPFSPSLTIDNQVYDSLMLSYSHGSYTLNIRNENVGAQITFVTLSQNSTTINRSDILTTLFSGQYTISVSSLSSTSDINFFKLLTYYFGDLGYNRITYDFPVNIGSLMYLFANSDIENNVINNGYWFINDTFPVINAYDPLTTYSYTVFLGSFRANGVFYSSIKFHFSSVYGYYQHNDSGLYRWLIYDIPGNTTPIYSYNESYIGYWYLDSVSFVREDLSTLVWSSGYNKGLSSDNQNFDYVFNYNWVGDSYYSTSQYRSIYIYYASDSLNLSSDIHNPFTYDFPQLDNLTFADFLNYIGEAYPSPTGGVPQDNTSPFVSVFEWLRIALSGAMPLFSYMLIPGISIGTLIMVPITMSIILFVVKLFKR